MAKEIKSKFQTEEKPETKSYRTLKDYQYFTRPRDLPVFDFRWIEQMLYDPTIRLGLAMRAGPLCAAEFAYQDDKRTEWIPGIKASSPDVARFVLGQLELIWDNHIRDILKSQIWGWSAGEVVYHYDEQTDLVGIRKLLPRHARDVRAMTLDGSICGVRFDRITDVGKVDLEFPKCYYHAYDPDAGQHYGSSILFGAFSSWADKSLEGGGADVRRLFMHKDAYGGAEFYYDDKTFNLPSNNGTTVSGREIAQEIVEQSKAGSVRTIPSVFDDKGNRLWEWKNATMPSSPTHILDYPKDLDTEMLRGMEIPDDVITAEATGAWQGKQVPMMAFYTGLDGFLNSIIGCLKTQIFDHLVSWNFGESAWYEIKTKPLPLQAMELAKGDETQQPQQGQQGQPPTQMSSEPSCDSIPSNVVRAAQRILMGNSAKAPKGGVTVQGKEYPGGQFIPGDVMDQATDEEKAAIGVEGDSQKGQITETKKTKNTGQITEIKKEDTEKLAKEIEEALSKFDVSKKGEKRFVDAMEGKDPTDVVKFIQAKNDGVAIPLAWTQVEYFGKDENLRARGRDEAGRRQPLQNPAHTDRVSLENNKRISRELTPRIAQVRQQLKRDAEAGSTEAKVLYLMAVSAFRIGGDGDGKAKKKAYGAANLSGEHVKVDGDKVTFDFPGKKGVQQEHVVEDKTIADMLRNAKPGERVFDTNSTKTLKAWQGKYGGTKAHDIRHAIASEVATEEIEKQIPPQPKSETARKKLINEISAVVAAKLGNEPAQAYGTYIDKDLWEKVQIQ